MKEKVDYEIIPAKDDKEQWDIRIIKGPFVETVIRFGAISINEDDSGMLTFNYNIVSTPDETLTENNQELGDFAGQILIDIIEQSINDGSIIMEDQNEDERI